jgi:hypothetical protein
MAPAPANAEIFSTSRRDAARTMLAIRFSPERGRMLLHACEVRLKNVMRRAADKSTAREHADEREYFASRLV